MLIRKMFFVVVGVALLFVAAASAEPLQIKAGYNFLETARGSYTTLSIPAGFFGEKDGVPSDAVVNRKVSIEGRPIGSLGLSPASNIEVGAGNCHSGGGHYHCHTNSANLDHVDTITRVTNTSLGEVGTSDTVSLQFVALSLQTPEAAPLQVTFGGKDPTAYRLILALDSAKAQPVGSIVMTRLGERNGTMEVALPVAFKVSFLGGSTGSLGPVSLSAVLRSSDNTFTTR